MKVGKWCGHRLPDALRPQVDECGQVRCPECLVMVTPCDVLGKPIPIRSGEAFTVTFRVCGLLDGAHFCLLEPGHDGEHLMLRALALRAMRRRALELRLLGEEAVMGNTKMVQFDGVARPRVTREELKALCRGDDAAIHYRAAYECEAIPGAPTGEWVTGCAVTNSMGFELAVIAERVLWSGTIVRADLDWTDVRVYAVEGGVLGQPLVYEPAQRSATALEADLG